LWTTATFFYFLTNKFPLSKELFKQSLKKLWPLFLLTILNFLAIVCGFILLIIPGLILMIWFYFANYLLVIEDKRPVEAMKASKELVKGYFWPVVGSLIWLLLTSLLLMLAVVLVLSFVAWVLGRTEDFVSPLAGLISSWFLAPFITVYIVNLINNLKSIKKV
jgi:hypothetical protein